MLFFQQGNLTAVEWTAVRRELRRALDAVPPFRNADRQEINLAPYIQLQTITVRAFQVALKITEFFDPEVAKSLPTTPRTKVHGPLVHDLSSVAYEWIKKVEIPEDSFYKQLEGILQGPTAALALPAVSPAHLAAVLSVLSPSPQFPAPMRRKVPSYHDPIAQSGLKKLFLVGGRVEGKLFDNDGVKRVGGIQGGMDGLRAQLVSVLQGAGLSITSTLESTGRNLWVSLESHRFSVEEKQKEHEKGEKAEDARDAKHEEQEKSE
jgi:ribosomal protein L10